MSYDIQILNNRVNIPDLFSSAFFFFFKQTQYRFPCTRCRCQRVVIPPGGIACVTDKSVCLVMTSELCEIAAFNVHFEGVY